MEFLWGILILIITAVPVAILVLLIVNFNKVSLHERRLAALEVRIRELDASPAAEAAPDPPAPVRASIPQEARTATGTRLAAVAPRHSRTKEEWEALIGGKLLNRIGALALIIGIGFFLKYAFDQNWITETVRVLIGAASGTGLLIVGARSHGKGFQVFSQGLIGAGISILYLSVYASFNFYQLVAQVPAFLLMGGVTVIAFLQAFRYGSLAVSLLGWAGGFLTPILLSTGQVNEVGLFSYLILLDAGILAIVVLKDDWGILEPLTLGATYLMYLSWHIRFYNEDHIVIGTAFVSFIWGLFFALELLHRGKRAVSLLRLREAVAVLSPFLFFVALDAIIDPHDPRWMGGIALLLGVIYISAWWDTRIRFPELIRDHARLALVGVAFIVIATSIEYSGFTRAVLWALQGAALCWIGTRLHLRYILIASPLLLGLAILQLLGTRGSLQFVPIEDFSPVLNERFLSYFLVAGSIALVAYLTKTDGDAAIRTLRRLMSYAFFLVIFILVTAETRDIFGRTIRDGSSGEGFLESDSYRNLINGRELATSGVWLSLSVVLMALGIRLRARGPRIAAIALFGLSILKMFLFDLSFLDTLHRIVSFIGLGVILLGVSYLYQKNKAIILGESLPSEAAR